MNDDIQKSSRPISNGVKRVLIFSLAYYPRRVSGAEAAIREITDRISPSDIEFHMITLRFSPEDPRHETIGSVHVHRVGIGPSYISKMSFIPLAVLSGIIYCRKYKIDALWAMMTYMIFPVAFMRLLGVRKPYLITLQDGDPYEKVFERWFIRPFAPLLDYGFRNARVVQAISGYLAAWPRKRGFTGPVEVVGNGADPDDLREDIPEATITALKHTLLKKEGEVFLVNTARLEHQKAFDDTIRALALLPQHIRLVVVGSGSLEASLRELVRSLSLSERVIFVGQVDRNEATLYRRASDIFVAPSRSEGLGNAFLSAMASRVPVVATQEGGLAEFVFDAKRNPGVPPTAFVVDRDAPEQIAAVVQRIIAEPAEVREVTENAHRMVFDRFTWESVAKNMQGRVFTVLFDSSI